MRAGRVNLSPIEIALAEVKRDLAQRASLPLFRLDQPEHPSFDIEGRALPAEEFLTANLHQSIHELHSSRVKSSVWETSRTVLSYLDPHYPAAVGQFGINRDRLSLANHRSVMLRRDATSWRSVRSSSSQQRIQIPTQSRRKLFMLTVYTNACLAMDGAATSMDFEHDLPPSHWETKALRHPKTGSPQPNPFAIEALIGLGLVTIRDGVPGITEAGRKVLVRGSSRLLDVAA